MNIQFLLAGIIFLISGLWGLINVLKNPDKDSPLYSFDLSVKMGTIGSIIFGLFLIYQSFNIE